jgi:polyhydroxyalkanoate synthesis regulator phasin
MSDIVERLREESATWDDPLLIDAADEIERLRAARLKIEQQANRIDELEAEVARLREALEALKNDNWPQRL